MLSKALALKNESGGAVVARNADGKKKLWLWKYVVSKFSIMSTMD